MVGKSGFFCVLYFEEITDKVVRGFERQQIAKGFFFQHKKILLKPDRKYCNFIE